MSLKDLPEAFSRRDDGAKRKIHMVDWETICKAKEKRGLGLKNLKHMNALLAKLTWRLITKGSFEAKDFVE